MRYKIFTILILLTVTFSRAQERNWLLVLDYIGTKSLETPMALYYAHKDGIQNVDVDRVWVESDQGIIPYKTKFSRKYGYGTILFEDDYFYSNDTYSFKVWFSYQDFRVSEVFQVETSPYGDFRNQKINTIDVFEYYHPEPIGRPYDTWELMAWFGCDIPLDFIVEF